MDWITVVLLIIILCLLIIIWNYQRQVKDICRQLAFLKENDSNMMITRQIDAGGIGKLVELLNQILEVRKKERKVYLEKEQAIADTYTNLSHDIRTPLTSLDGYVQLLSESRDEKEQEYYLGIVRERISSLKDMLEELFIYTKLKNESYQPDLKDCDLNRVLKETLFSYYEDWLRLGIELEFAIEKEPLHIMADDKALRRVIQNIIKNGMDHGSRRIKISLDKIGKAAVLVFQNEVENPGEIDPEKVFERFYKADRARSRNTTGLGLSIAREFVLKMDGEIWAEIDRNYFLVKIKVPLCK